MFLLQCEEIAQILNILFCREQNDFQNQLLELYEEQIKNYLQVPFFADFAQSILVHMLSCYPSPYDQIEQYFIDLKEILSNYSQSLDPRNRNAAICGFKIILIQADPLIFPIEQTQKMSLFFRKEYFKKFESIQWDNEIQLDNKRYYDDIISALGYLLKYYLQDSKLRQELSKFWFTKLPLNITQGNEQQSFLIDILFDQPELILNQPKNILTLCQIYAKFVMKRGDQVYKEIVAKTKLSFLRIRQSKLFKQSESYLWEKLIDIHKKVLLKLIAS